MIDLALVENVVVRSSSDEVKRDDELVCEGCDQVICDIEVLDSLGLLVRTALDHLSIYDGAS